MFPLLDQQAASLVTQLHESHRRRPRSPGYVAVIHHDPGRYPNLLAAHNRLRGTRPLFVFGRSVFETDCIPSDWIPHTALVDELWSPSTAGSAAFSRCGCIAPVHAIPPPLAPTHAAPRPLKEQRGGAHRGLRLLSVFKWEAR